MIWMALGIPMLFGALLWFFFNRKVTWWEVFVPLLVSLVLIIVCRWTIEYIQCTDTEFWTGWAVKAEYHEHWNELHEWDETVTETVGSGKNARTVTKTVHHSEVIDHPPEWFLVDSNGIKEYISSGRFEEFCKRWENRKFHPMFHGYTIHGDMYRTTFPGGDEKMEVVSSSHWYQNRILASHSVFKFIEPKKDEKKAFGLYDYPTISGYTMPCILGANDPKAERQLSLLNAKIGKDKQIRVWVLVYHDQPMQAAMMQESLWQGGNKNELVLCIGVDKENEIQWGHVFSWTDEQTLKIECRDKITDQKKLDLPKLVADVEPLVRQGWVRKEFKDFNYLSVDPPIWAVGMTYFLTFCTNIGVSVWMVKNGGIGASYYTRRWRLR